MTSRIVHSSFRDPSGFLFFSNNLIYRQINKAYKRDYDELISSGLYETLIESCLLLPHHEVEIESPLPGELYKIIEPEQVPFISYPHEWSFSQLKDAALTTLKIQKKALDFGMSLKDASAYNIQFLNGKPIFIDTLSFEKYKEGEPWVAYRQFCQHFLAPLALMSYTDVRLNQLFRVYIDGAPIDLASTLLPFRTRFNPSIFSHIHLHAKSQKHYADKKVNTGKRKISRMSLLGIIDNLESTIRKLKWHPQGTEWAEYYEDTNYSKDSFNHKKQLVDEFLDKTNPQNIWDLGANTGEFSRIASNKGIKAIAFDIDPSSVEKNYLKCSANGETDILPLLLDLTNPSPAIGWKNEERMSLIERGPTDTTLALALIHHLAISNNLPFSKIADFLSKTCDSLIIEFVPKEDSKVQKLLSTREDIFSEYTQPFFEQHFKEYFAIEDSKQIRDSKRTIYLMKRRKA